MLDTSKWKFENEEVMIIGFYEASVNPKEMMFD